MSTPKEIYRVCIGVDQFKYVELMTREDYPDTAVRYIRADIVEEISQKIEIAISDLISLDSQQALVQLESIPTLKKYLEDK